MLFFYFQFVRHLYLIKEHEYIQYILERVNRRLFSFRAKVIAKKKKRKSKKRLTTYLLGVPKRSLGEYDRDLLLGEHFNYNIVKTLIIQQT